MTAWQLRCQYKELKRQQLALQKAIQRASDPAYTLLTKDGVKFLQAEKERIRRLMVEINGKFERKEFI